MKKLTNIEGLAETGQRFRYKINGVNDSILFLKANIGKNQGGYLEREGIALDWLKGLAVPKRISVSSIPIDRIAHLNKSKEASYLAMEWVPWRDCWSRKFSTAQAVGIWAFILEQLCAFRRKKIIYTDIKPSHFLISDDFSIGKIIDFDGCVMLERSGIYPIEVFQITPEFSGPETYFSWKHTERIIVYQMGMLLGNLLVGRLKNADLNEKSLGKIKRKCLKNDIQPLWSLFEKCISEKPSGRPRDLEVLFSRLEKIKLSPAASQIWIKLRTPYLRQLTKLGFEGPSVSQTQNNTKKAA